MEVLGNEDHLRHVVSRTSRFEGERSLETENQSKRHFSTRLIVCVFGMGFGSLSFGYAAAIIATTLGTIHRGSL